MKQKRLISLILTVLLVFSIGVTGLAAAEEQIDGSNWMSAIDGEKKITAITIPGTHDSATVNADANAVSRTQSLTIAEQLYAGVRYFDIRLKMSGDTFFSVHSVVYNRKNCGLFTEKLTADDIIADFKAFLENNPQETVLMLLKEEGSNKGTDFYTGFYNKYIEPDIDSWYIQNDHVPTLDECRGKIVVLRYNSVDDELFDNTNSAISFQGYPYINNYKTDDFRFTQIYMTKPEDETAEEPESYTGLYVQDSFRLAPDKKWTAVSSFLSLEHKPWYYSVCVTSSSANGSPYYNALIINSKLMEYPFAKGTNYGIVSVDFASAELCSKLYTTNVFTLEPAAATALQDTEQSFGFMGEFLMQIRTLIEKTVAAFAQLKIK
ncbi:MAG: phosphatidylinositol-specific phospholipase C domain-containing protein [Acutalibacteraceae bacterium]